MSNEASRRPGGAQLATRVRRDSSNTLVYADVLRYLETIKTTKSWADESQPQLDQVLRMRDSALIAGAWLYIPRRTELVSLKLGALLFTDELRTEFLISKKARRVKICERCGARNAGKVRNENKALPFQPSAFCSVCGQDISGTPLTVIAGRMVKKSLAISMKEPLTAYIVTWANWLWKRGATDDSWLFPGVDKSMRGFDPRRHLSGKRFYQICRRLDDSLTPHIFRYGHCEALLRMRDKNGLPMFSHSEISEIIGWSSTAMVDLYSMRHGLTVSGAKYSQLIGNG
jgi:hypothetical protein